MFKKPLSNLKTSAPLRSSDRRKLKQRVVNTFGISSEDGDLLVPDGIQSVKFSTHVEEPGLAYLSNEGDPLWFTIGKGSDDLIPTVYTLWKKEDLLPFISTPSAVIPNLVRGADLMVPGVIHHPPALEEGKLVVIRQYTRPDGQPTLSPPVAVGRMALSSDVLSAGGQETGKAVLVLHTWKDHLFEMGSKVDMPAGTALSQTEISQSYDVEQADSEDESRNQMPPTSAEPTPAPKEVDAVALSYTPHEVTELLNKSLLQAIATTLSFVPPSTFPIPATLFYTNYILPSRPAFPTLILSPSSASTSAGNQAISDEQAHIAPQEITVKASTHKSLTAFLKTAEKASLLTLKAPQKHSQQTDLLITSVNAKSSMVLGHNSYVTVKDLELKAAKKAEREEKEKENKEGKGEVEVKEFWKPHQASVELIEGLGGDKSTLYTLPEIRALVNSYVSLHKLVNPNDQAYINLDAFLMSALSAKSKGKSKGKGVETEQTVAEFMKRDELTKAISEMMQTWYEVRAEGRDPVCKKGTLKPIQVVVKVRQGRKASTLITGFEPFLVVNAEEIAEDLRKLCAGATSVGPIAGKPAGSGLEVLVQGKQSKAVYDYLTGKGVPKKWIEVSDLSGKK